MLIPALGDLGHGNSLHASPSCSPCSSRRWVDAMIHACPSIREMTTSYLSFLSCFSKRKSVAPGKENIPLGEVSPVEWSPCRRRLSRRSSLTHSPRCPAKPTAPSQDHFSLSSSLLLPMNPRLMHGRGPHPSFWVRSEVRPLDRTSEPDELATLHSYSM